MKYVVQWTMRSNSTEAEMKRGLQVFAKWSPPAGSTFHQFLSRIDGRGGFAVVETDDPKDVLRDASIFGIWFDFEVFPCLEILDAVVVNQQGLDFVDSVPT